MIIHSPIISGSLTFSSGASLTLPNPTTVNGTFNGIVNSTNGVISGSVQVDGTGITNNSISIAGNNTALGGSVSLASIVGNSGIVSQSAQIDGASIQNKSVSFGGVSVNLNASDDTPAFNLSDATNYPGDSNLVTLGTVTTGNVNAILPSGVISGSDQLTSTFDSRYLNTNSDGIVSGSSQITLSSTSGFNANEHFTQAQITTVGTVTTGNVNAILPDGVVSGSSQISVTNAIVAGGAAIDSSKINYDGTGIVSSSAQVSALAGINNSTITVGVGGGLSVSADNDFTLNQSGNQSITIGTDGSGIVSGSSQISLASVSGYNANEHFTQGQITTLGTVTSGNVTAILPSGVISSSAQVEGDFLEINGDGVVSGSSQIDHDSTTGFVSNEHINHSSVSITAGNGLTGGGDITTSRTINVVGGDGINANANDIEVDNTVLRTTGQGVVSGSEQVSHDSTTGFVSNEHIDHSTITIGSGKGLSGGGTIVTSRSLTLNTGSAHFSSGVVESLPAGTVSGSSQIDVTSTTNYVAPAITDNSGTPTLVSGITAAEVRSAIGVDASGTDNSTDVTLANTNYLSLSGQQLTGGTVPIGSGGTGATTAGAARTALGVDAAGTDNSTDVTLAGSYDYITISGQTITRNQITNDDLAGSIANGKLANSGIGIGNGGTIDLGESVSVANILKGSGVISGSAQVSLSGFDTDDLSEGSTNKYATTANVKSALNANLGTLTLGDGNDTVTIPGNLTVTGTTTTNNVETVSTSNGVVFEGSVADDNEITLLAGTVTADRTITLPDATGTVALTSDIPTNNNQLTNGAGYITSFDITTQTDSKYLRSNANDTASGIITLSNSTASSNKTTGALVVTGGVGISGALNVGGDVVAFASSDERLKDNIELISNPIEKVQSLKGVTWNWNDNADELQQSLPNVGVIAQDVEKVLPQLVTDRDNGFKGVDYAKLTGLLIEAIKDQQKQIDELKSKLS